MIRKPAESGGARKAELRREDKPRDRLIGLQDPLADRHPKHARQLGLPEGRLAVRTKRSAEEAALLKSFS